MRERGGCARCAAGFLARLVRVARRDGRKSREGRDSHGGVPDPLRWSMVASSPVLVCVAPFGFHAQVFKGPPVARRVAVLHSHAEGMERACANDARRTGGKKRAALIETEKIRPLQQIQHKSAVGQAFFLFKKFRRAGGRKYSQSLDICRSYGDSPDQPKYQGFVFVGSSFRV
jgi:hypothetical protein